MCRVRDWIVYFEFISAGNNVSTTKVYNQDDQHINIRAKFDELNKTHDVTNERQVRDLFKDSGGDSGWRVNLQDTKTKYV